MTLQEPGCYSIPSVFSFESPVCKACALVRKCQTTSREKLQGLPTKSIAIQRLLREHELFEHNNPRSGEEGEAPIAVTFAKEWNLTDDQEDRLNKMPATAAKYFKTLIKRGVICELEEARRKRKNPFSEYGQRAAHIAFNHLRDAGGFNRVSLTEVIGREMGWTRNSAGAQAAVLWHVFLALKLATEVPGEDWALFNPSTADDNNDSTSRETK